MKTLLFLTFSFFLFYLHAFSQDQSKPAYPKKVSILLYEDGTWAYAVDGPQVNSQVHLITQLEIPKTNPGDNIISHTGYSFLFSDRNKQSKWVAYELTSEETTKLYERTDKFMQDPSVKSGTATDADYAGSGYDKGHLAPAADMGWSAASMAESFYYSNMSPQVPAFNRGIWKKLEELVRTWAVDNEALYIVTGPVLSNGLPSIGPDKVSVPKYFYKVILDYTEPGINGIGFILPNAGSSEPLQSFAVTIDSVEKLTGIDFYPSIPATQQTQIEKTLCINCWSWKSSNTGTKTKGATKASTSVQCKGTTKSGSKCKNKTSDPSGYCYLHLSQSQGNSNPQTAPAKTERKSTSVQCSGTTKAGTRCKHMTYSPNGRCYQHGGD